MTQGKRLLPVALSAPEGLMDGKEPLENDEDMGDDGNPDGKDGDLDEFSSRACFDFKDSGTWSAAQAMSYVQSYPRWPARSWYEVDGAREERCGVRTSEGEVENILDLRAEEGKHLSPEERLCMAICIANFNEGETVCFTGLITAAGKS